MKYISTRGGIAPIPFKEAILMGLATDGGLLLPRTLPILAAETVQAWLDDLADRKLTYQQLAFEIISMFVDDIPADDLKSLVERSYASFTHPRITPVIKKGDIHILELFHGPTLAFKDLALQFLGNLFEYILKEKNSRMNIIGATSGDTGSAAIYGVRGRERINIFILHPYKRVSPTQELQMTTVLDPNVFNLAIRGTFDDGQAIVKKLFNDIPFKESHHLGAINSINWARILAQVVYYVYAWLVVTVETGSTAIDFSVPTGNFGDIFAGYVAKRMLGDQRINKLILATNENNLLTRFVNQGDYSISTVKATSSPSMDIQVASNFERYLYYLNNENPQKTVRDMEDFARNGRLAFAGEQLTRVRSDFVSKSVSEDETRETIRSFFEAQGYILDPHTAVGVNAALALAEKARPIICLATAHPAKFGEAVQQAVGRTPDMPEPLRGLAELKSRCQIMEADADAVQAFVSANSLK